MRWHAEDAARHDDDAVLNACRAWHYAVERTWSSKLDAGRWAQTRLDDPGLVRRGLEAYSDGGRLQPEHVEMFLGRVLRLLESAMAVPYASPRRR